MQIPNRDTESFNRLFRKHKDSFTQFAKSYVRDVMAAEDIYMESMLQYWEKMSNLPADTNVAAYILTIVKNKSLNYLRHQLVELEMQNKIGSVQQREISMNISSLEVCNPSDLFANDIQDIIANTLKDMSENTKDVFYLSRFDNHTNKEIAKKLNITEKGVEYHMSKALKALRITLKDYLPFLLFFLFSI